MVQRRHHYEAAFEAYLRRHRIPYLAVNEARQALLPQAAASTASSLKSFDLVVYRQGLNLLADIKGRRSPQRPGHGARLENWVTLQDLHALEAWEGLFGDGFVGAFIFMYWSAEQPPDGAWPEVFAHRNRWYAPRLILRPDYATRHGPRSMRWQTVQLPRAAFDRYSSPFRAPPPARARAG